MKVAFILDMFPSLAETFILNQITGLMDLGHDIEIFAGKRSTEAKMHPEIEDYGLLERTHYHNEVPQNTVHRTIKGLLLLVTLFPRYPMVILRSLNVFKYGGDASSLYLLYKVALFLREGSFDIIQCHFGHNGNLGVLLKEMGIHGQVVTMFHGYDLRRAADKGATMYAKLIQCGDCLLAISNYTERHLLAFGADPKRIVRHPVGIDIERFPFRWTTLLHALPSPTRILTVARLREEKGIAHGIQAINRLLNRRTDLSIEYEVVGDGPLMNDLRNLVTSLNLTHVVNLSGARDHEGVVRAMGKAHLFLLPSNAEVLPVVLMEAQATGLPVVATSVGGVPEIVSHGRSGYLVSKGDVRDMAERLENLISHPRVWLDMGREGRRIIEQRFHIGRLNERLVEIYEGLLAS